MHLLVKQRNYSRTSFGNDFADERYASHRASEKTYHDYSSTRTVHSRPNKSKDKHSNRDRSRSKENYKTSHTTVKRTERSPNSSPKWYHSPSYSRSDRSRSRTSTKQTEMEDIDMISKKHLEVDYQDYASTKWHTELSRSKYIKAEKLETDDPYNIDSNECSYRDEVQRKNRKPLLGKAPKQYTGKSENEFNYIKRTKRPPLLGDVPEGYPVDYRGNCNRYEVQETRRKSLLGDLPSSYTNQIEKSSRFEVPTKNKKSLLGDGPTNYSNHDSGASNYRNKTSPLVGKSTDNYSEQDNSNFSSFHGQIDAGFVDVGGLDNYIEPAHLNRSSLHNNTHNDTHFIDPFKDLGNKFKVIDYNHQPVDIESLQLNSHCAPSVLPQSPYSNTSNQDTCVGINEATSKIIHEQSVQFNKTVHPVHQNEAIHHEEVTSQLKSLAALISSESVESQVRDKSPSSAWRLIKLQPPLRSLITKDSIDIQLCCRNDPRIAHLIQPDL